MMDVTPGAVNPGRKRKQRLGRGLSSLIGTTPVQVEVEAKAQEPASAEQDPVSPQPEEAVQENPQYRGVPADRVVQLVPLKQISVNPLQPRRVFDEAKLKELAASIASAGLMQPIVVRPKGTGKAENLASGVAQGDAGLKPAVQEFELIAGERRWRAAAIAGLAAIPAIVREVTDEVSAEWALIENVQREDLGPLEKGEAFRVLAERFGLTHEEIARRVGLERSSVSNLVRLTELEAEIRDLLDGGGLGMGHGRALLGVAPGPRRVELAQRAAREEWSVRQLETAIRDGAAAQTDLSQRIQREVKAADELDRPASIRDLEKQLGEHLGTKVKIKGSKDWKRGKIVIEFFDLDQFDGLMGKMGFAMTE